MKNVEMTVEGNILTIKVDLTKDFGPSSSGKTIIIASTEGNVSISDTEEAKVGFHYGADSVSEQNDIPDCNPEELDHTLDDDE